MTRVEQRLSELLDAAAPPSAGVPFETIARRVRRRRAMRWSVVASTLAVAAVVAGVVSVTATGGGGNSRLATEPTQAPKPSHDLVALTRHVTCPQRPTTVPAGQLGAFHAVTVVTCGQEPRELPGEGQWLVDVRRVATDGVAALQAAFERPDEPATNGVCTLNLVAIPPLVLVNGTGRTLTPTAPVDGCHKPQQQFMAALRAVSWADVSIHKVRQIVSAQAEAAGCPQQYKNMTFVDSQMGTHASSGGPLSPRTPTPVHVCLYQVTGSDFEVGTFQRGFVLSGAEMNRLLVALSGAGVGGNCTAQRRFAAVLGNGWATVELGGCWRVARSYPNSALGSANGSAVGAVLSGH